MTRFLLLFLTLVSFNAIATTQVYVTRDAEGNLIFSDRPSADAETHEVEALPTVPAFKVKKQQGETEPVDLEPENFYTNVQILSPNNEANIPHGLASELSAVIDVQPALRPDDEIILTVDGNTAGRGTSNSYPLKNLSRGKHILEARIVDDRNRTLLKSRTINIYIQQPSLLNRRPVND